jgi:hypothetical protein
MGQVNCPNWARLRPASSPTTARIADDIAKPASVKRYIEANLPEEGLRAKGDGTA